MCPGTIEGEKGEKKGMMYLGEGSLTWDESWQEEN